MVDSVFLEDDDEDEDDDTWAMVSFLSSVYVRCVLFVCFATSKGTYLYAVVVLRYSMWNRCGNLRLFV